MSRSSASKDGRTGIYGRGDEKAHLRREEEVKLKEEARARSKLAFYCEGSRERLKSVNLIKQPNCSHYR